MAQELLDGAQVHARLEKVRREGVAQSVRVEMVEIRSAVDCLVELAPDGAVAETAAALVDEERFVLIDHRSPPTRTFRQVSLDGPCGRPAERHQSFLPSFAAHPDQSLPELEITEIESHELADAETGSVQELDGGAIAAPGWGVGKTLEKFLDSVTIGDFRCSFDIAGVGHGVSGACIDGALGDQESKVCAKSGESATDRARLQASRVEVGEVGSHGCRRHTNRALEAEFVGDKTHKRSNFTSVGTESRRREVALPFQVFQEFVDQPGSLYLLAIAVTHSSPPGGGSSFPWSLHHQSRSMAPNISVE